MRTNRICPFGHLLRSPTSLLEQSRAQEDPSAPHRARRKARTHLRLPCHYPAAERRWPLHIRPAQSHKRSKTARFWLDLGHGVMLDRRGRLGAWQAKLSEGWRVLHGGGPHHANTEKAQW